MNYLSILSLTSMIVLTACGSNASYSSSDPIVERLPVISETPSPTPAQATPTPAPTVAPTPIASKASRVFVTATVVNGGFASHSANLNRLCKSEAKAAKVKGKFAALVAIQEAPFLKRYSIPSEIYQIIDGKKSLVSESFEKFAAGESNAIVAYANGRKASGRYENVWIGHKDIRDASNPKINCSNWQALEGEAIVGHLGKDGAEQIAYRYLNCNQYAHLYCIEYR